MLVSCGPVKNYDEPDQPVYTGQFATGKSDPSDSLKIVTWNLSFAENLDAAIETLNEVKELEGADIILLQEMDDIGIEKLAKELRYNYVYYPASVHPRHNKKFGNAVLTRWEITDHEKVNLPKIGLGRKHTRNAVKAKIKFGNKDLIAYSIHLETFWFMQPVDQRQATFLGEQINDRLDIVIIGGDFNSLTKGSIKFLEKNFSRIDIHRLSKNTGYTFENMGLKLTLDHIFASEDENNKSGVWRGSEASDHFPIWSVISLEQTR